MKVVQGKQKKENIIKYEENKPNNNSPKTTSMAKEFLYLSSIVF